MALVSRPIKTLLFLFGTDYLHTKHGIFNMGMFSFIKEAGEKLFGRKDIEAAAASAAANPATDTRLAELNGAAGKGIAAYVEAQKLGIEDLLVDFDGHTGVVTLRGNAPCTAASEKAALSCGNVSGVGEVSNLLVVSAGADESRFHDVVSGDTLSGIAKKVYGNAGKYMAIFEANQPMLSHPDKIYPGQKLRIPAID